MFGECLREIAVLVFVFGPLDKLVHNELTVVWLGWATVIAATAFVVGATLERRRP